MVEARIVIGIDPGTAITGYGVVQEEPSGALVWIAHDVITTPSEWDEPDRLLFIFKTLQEVFQQYQPDSCAVEKLFFQKNVKTALKVGQGRGAALMAAAAAGLSVGEYTPMVIKQAVVGYGKADKNQVQQMVKLLLNLEDIPRPDDAADALAVAICHLHSTKQTDMISHD